MRLIGDWIDNEVEAEHWKKDGHPQQRLDELLNDKTIRPGQRQAMSAAEVMALAEGL